MRASASLTRLATAWMACWAMSCGDGASGREAEPDASEAPAPIVAPELEGGVAWLNVDSPLTLAGLRGHVVLLDFWTFGCVNCINMVPVYREIEDTFEGEPFVVIGVHSGNSEKERDPENVAVAVETLEVRHPVVVDSEQVIWDTYGVGSWPTALLIDAQGIVRLVRFGEFSPRDIEEHIRDLIGEARRAGTAADPPFRYRVEPPATDETPLRFPTKVTVLVDGRVAVADTAHHRIVIAAPDGQLDAVIGTGASGWGDGSFDEAELQRPHGLVELDGDLYVADALNHAVRRIDFDSREVSTVAGNGGIGETSYSVDDGWMPATDITLRTPWALEAIDGDLAVALAGSHQIAAIDVGEGRLRIVAGSGAEGMDDGPAAAATFAQPSGLARSADGETLYVADPESSAVRAVALADGSVRTLVGQGLHVTGDRDGTGADVLLSHVSGLSALEDGTLLMVDTFNSKLRSLDPARRVVRTVDLADDLVVDQPQGLARRDRTVYIADTNRHRIVQYDLKTGRADVFSIEGLAPPAAP